MTLRRLYVLILALPAEAPLWAVLRAAQEEANKATPDKIRDRAREWQERNNRAKEATDG